MAQGPPSTVEMHSDLVFEVTEPSVLALHVAGAASVERARESFEVEPSDATVEVIEIGDAPRNRAHVVRVEPGRLAVHYRAVVTAGPVAPTAPTPAERLVALRQSRYSPSDLVEGYVAVELGHLRGDPTAGTEVAEWVHRRLLYEPGSSGPSDTAVDTLLHGMGVCRDFAHVTVTLCRSLGLPARFVAVYAPGLSPMDFHAVAEVAGPDGWEIVDATRLAPRQSLVRIATGRDAADTALVTTVEGHADLLESSVVAFTAGDLPIDDHRSSIAIA